MYLSSGQRELVSNAQNLHFLFVSKMDIPNLRNKLKLGFGNEEEKKVLNPVALIDLNYN